MFWRCKYFFKPQHLKTNVASVCRPMLKLVQLFSCSVRLERFHCIILIDNICGLTVKYACASNDMPNLWHSVCHSLFFVTSTITLTYYQWPTQSTCGGSLCCSATQTLCLCSIVFLHTHHTETSLECCSEATTSFFHPSNTLIVELLPPPPQFSSFHILLQLGDSVGAWLVPCHKASTECWVITP